MEAASTDARAARRARNREKKFMRELLKTNNLPHPRKWCVNMRQIQLLGEQVTATISRSVGEEVISMHAVVRQVVRPVTDACARSYALFVNPEGLKVSIFVSHCWKEDFYTFMGSIQQYLGSVKRRRAMDLGIWICAFAIPQNNSELVKDLLNVSLEFIPFAQALRYAQRMLCVRSVEADLHTRPWCICEMYFATEFADAAASRRSRLLAKRGVVESPPRKQKPEIRAVGPDGPWTGAAVDIEQATRNCIAGIRPNPEADARRLEYERIIDEIRAAGKVELVNEIINRLKTSEEVRVWELRNEDDFGDEEEEEVDSDGAAEADASSQDDVDD